MDSGSTRDQKLIFLNSGDNIDGNGFNFQLQFPSERFRAQEPAKMRLNIHQFQMRKTWPNINRSNRRFFMALATDPEDQLATDAGYVWQPVDLVDQLIPTVTRAWNATPDDSLQVYMDTDLEREGKQKIGKDQINCLNIKDIARCPMTKWADGGPPAFYPVDTGNSVNAGVLNYSYEEPLLDSRDLRAVLEYSINMRLNQLAYGLRYDSRYDIGGSIPWLQRYTGGVEPLPGTQTGCLAVQVHFTEMGRFEIYFCNGLPRNRYPQYAANILGAGSGVPIWSGTDATWPLGVKGGSSGVWAPCIYFSFPQIKNASAADLVSGIEDAPDNLKAWPNISSVPVVGNQGFASDPQGTFNDSGEILGAYMCRANQSTTNESRQFQGLALPAVPGVSQNFIGSSGLIPICTPRISNLPNLPGECGVVGWRFPSQPTLSSWTSIHVHAENVQSNNYESIGFTQGHDKSQQKMSVPSTLMAKIPLPTLEYQVDSTGWAADTRTDGVAGGANTLHRPGAYSTMVGTNVYDKVQWECPFAQIFGITLDNPVLNNIKIYITDDKGRRFEDIFYEDFAAAGQNDLKALVQNSALEMTLCFHVIYNPPLPKPIDDESPPVTTAVDNTLLGGANSNRVMMENAMMNGSYFVDND